MELKDKVVLVTGASSGIGRSVAERLSDSGAVVVGCARDPHRLAAAGEALGMEVVSCDMSRREDRERLVETVLTRHGRVDVLVNNAGIGWEGLVEEIPPEMVEELYATNVVGLVDLTRRLLPQMLERGSGAIVMMSSVAAYASVPPLTVYSSTKYAVDGFVEGLRREVGLRGVQVHSVNPFLVQTEWLARSRGYQPQEGESSRSLSPGIPVSWVADAVLRSLRRPYSRTVSVPRAAGSLRLLQVQPVRLLTDLAFGAAAGPLARRYRRVALDRLPEAERSSAERSPDQRL